MLNVSATQELYKKVIKLENENSFLRTQYDNVDTFNMMKKLKTENELLKTTINVLVNEVSKINDMLEQNGQSRVSSVSEDTPGI